MTFVCGTNEKDKLNRFAEICNVCISPLPGELLAISRPPKVIAAYVFAQYLFIYLFIGLCRQSGGYGGPSWRLGDRA